MATEILGRLKELPDVQKRRAAAILGAIVADAATTPLHWIYDQGKVADLAAKAAGNPEFYPVSQCPFYTVPTGSTSTYGDQTILTLKIIAENQGFNAASLADAIFSTFGPGTPYEETRKQRGQPVKGPWTNHNIKTFLAKREEGEKPEADAGSKDPDGIVKSVPVVSLLSGKPDLLSNVQACVTTTQSNPVAVGYALAAARILDHVIQTGSDGLDTAVQQLKDSNRDFKYETDDAAAADIEKAKAASGKSHTEAVKEFGLPCPMPTSFYGMIHGIAVATSFQSAVRANILAAGDNCSRGGFIGAVVAARYGLDSIPEEWIRKVTRAEEVLGYIEKLVQL